MTEVLLDVNGLGKKYAKTVRTSLRYGMRDVISETFGRRRGAQLRTDEFWALSGVSFQVKRGECLAVLGGNGAGKSTLLKLLSGILTPDVGRVEANGRIEKMIELLAGMAPALSGRENVLLRARLLGLDKREAAARLDEVVDFSELDDSIDMPVMFYSSGMRARLGFATTVVMSPDILLIDEVLAVGDLGFRMKCYERVDEMRNGAAVVLVTHGMGHVARMATSALVLHKGRVALLGSPQAGIAKYQELAGGQKAAKEAAFNPDLIDFEMLDDRREVCSSRIIDHGERIMLRGLHRVPQDLSISAILHEGNGPTIADWNSLRSNFRVRAFRGFELDVGALELCPGYYQWVVVGFDSSGTQRFLSRPLKFRVGGVHLGATRMQPKGRWIVDTAAVTR